jgi:hypothetical protein
MRTRSDRWPAQIQLLHDVQALLRRPFAPSVQPRLAVLKAPPLEFCLHSHFELRANRRMITVSV